MFFLRLKKNKKSGSAQHGRNQIAAVLPLIRICRRCFMTTSGLSVPRHWSFQFFQDFQFFDGAKLEQLQFHPQQESQPPLADDGRQVAERLRERPCRGSHERVWGEWRGVRARSRRRIELDSELGRAKLGPVSWIRQWRVVVRRRVDSRKGERLRSSMIVVIHTLSHVM